MKQSLQVASPRPRLVHFSPLRYPGGKGKLAAFVKNLIKANRLMDGEYAEPYAGGAAVALELLFHGYMSRVHINDLSRPVYAFWDSVLNDTDRLCERVRNTPLTLSAWDRQKRIFEAQDSADNLALGFATFFLNRTNRSGILNGGVIGGRDQSGPWKIDARFNRAGLIYRIESIAKLNRRICLTQLDALEFVKAGIAKWPTKTLIYLDPPYYEKGRDLYYDFYQHGDHEELARFVIDKLGRRRWIISYDNVAHIRELYKGCQGLTYGLGYSARSASEGSELMCFSESLQICPLVGPFRLIRRSVSVRKNENASLGAPTLQNKRTKRAVCRSGHKPERSRNAAKAHVKASSTPVARAAR